MPAADSNPLLGAWHLQCWDISYSDGRAPTYPYGTDATGLIVYSSDGWMNACIARGHRARLSSDSVRQAPEAQRLAAFESYFSYAGPYTLREHQGQLQVVHAVTMSLNPNFVGTQQVRNMQFDAEGRLTLSADDTAPNSDVVRHHRLLWRRS
jgi:Lipocalin-like domain